MNHTENNKEETNIQCIVKYTLKRVQKKWYIYIHN